MLPFRRVLCPVDFSAPSLESLQVAAELAQEFGAELCVLHVVPLLLPYPNAVTGAGAFPSRDRKVDAQQHLDIVLPQQVPSGVRVHSEVKIGYAVNEITCFAAQNGYDLIVMAAHGQGGWTHLLFGSVATGVLHVAPCPVLLIHSQSAQCPKELKHFPQNCSPPINAHVGGRQLQYVHH